MIVKIQEDVYSYESKIWGNFNKRQLICILISLVIIATAFAIIFWTTNSIDLSAIISVVLCSPVLLCAIYNRDGQHLEQVMKYKYQSRFVYPQKRKHVMTNLYQEIEKNQKEYEIYNETLAKEEQPKKDESSKNFIAALDKKRYHSK